VRQRNLVSAHKSSQVKSFKIHKHCLESAVLEKTLVTWSGTAAPAHIGCMCVEWWWSGHLTVERATPSLHSD
jgi:hypothetical protein